MQFYPLVTIPEMWYFFPARYTHGSDIMVALEWNLLTKVLEIGSIDHGIYNAGHMVNGHALKHLAAALGAYLLYLMVKFRQPAGIS